MKVLAFAASNSKKSINAQLIRHAASVLETAVNSAARFGGLLKASLAVPKFYQNFDTQAGKLTNAEIQSSLKTALGKLFDIVDDA